MLILGIEAATASTGCAVGDRDGVRASVRVAGDRRHAEMLAPQISAVCEQAGVSLRDVAAVAVDVGPGLYTGLRVGVTTAMTIASALRVNMVGVTSLDLVAFPVRHTSRTITAVIDARRGEVFWARYRPVPGGVQRVSEPAVSSPEAVAAEIMAAGDEVLLAGDGALRYRSAFDSIRGAEIADRTFACPSAESLVHLACARALREEHVPPEQIRPLYLRRPDAEAMRSTDPDPSAASADPDHSAASSAPREASVP